MNKKYFDKLVAVLNAHDVDAILIAPSPEMNFIFGTDIRLCERFQAAIVKNTGEYFYICNLLYKDQIKAALPEDAEVYAWFDGEDFTDIVRDVFGKKGLIGKKIAVNSTERAFIVFQIMKDVDAELVDGHGLIEEMTLIKDETEKQYLRESSKVTDWTYGELLDYIRPGMTEKDILDRIKELFAMKGAAFKGAIAASGPNSSYPHYFGDKRVIEEKDIIVLDWGCRVGGLCSDMTRTIFVGGITEEEHKIYDIVLRAQEAGEAMAVNGAWVPDVDAAARNVIIEAGYGDYFTTRVGHGIGYGVHEAPDIKGSNRMHLGPGMCFSIEPGIYIGGRLGVRIEDLVLTTEEGHEILNHATKDIMVICKNDKYPQL